MTPVDFTLLAKAGTAPRAYKAGEVIFNEGDPADNLYVIQEGTVDIRLGNRTLATLRKNDMFGEMALIDKAPRSATAVAVGDASVVPVSEKQFLFLVSHTPYFALSVMRVLADRLRMMNRTL